MELDSSVQKANTNVVILMPETKSVRSEFQKYFDFFFAREGDHSDALNFIRDADLKNSIFFFCTMALYLFVMVAISSISPKDSDFSNFYWIGGITLICLLLVLIGSCAELILLVNMVSFVWIRLLMVINMILILSLNISIYYVFALFCHERGFSPFIVIVVMQSIFNLMVIYNWVVMFIRHHCVTTLFTILESYASPVGFTPLPVTTSVSV